MTKIKSEHKKLFNCFWRGKSDNSICVEVKIETVFVLMPFIYIAFVWLSMCMYFLLNSIRVHNSITLNIGVMGEGDEIDGIDFICHHEFYMSWKKFPFEIQ